jgi:hypothetical protein
MSKRPLLYLIEGRLSRDPRGIYRLREAGTRAAPAEALWPEAGAWRDLVHRLLGTPVKESG